MTERKGCSPLAWIAGLCLVIILLLGGCVVGCGALLLSGIKGVEPYQRGVELAQSDPRVIAELGSPVEPGLLPSGSINTSGGSGDADLAIPVSGPEGSGTVYVVAARTGGEWDYSVLRFEAESGTSVDLLAESPAP